MTESTGTLNELKTTTSLVESLLRSEGKCRNSDKWLSYRVYEEVARQNKKSIFIPFELFNLFPSFETIARVRRIFQNKKGKYLPTDRTVLEKRQTREGIIRDWSVQE